MRTLVTGAAGNLGGAVCHALHEAGHELVAVDQKYSRELPVRLQIEDLRDERATYRIAEGCEAIVHLANHTNQYARPMPQQVLTDNITMTANVFRAAQDMGAKRLVFSSSIQAVLGGDPRRDEHPILPYLPLDSSAPSRPRSNYYALSKEWGERLLQLMAAGQDDLQCTALRFPFLLTERHRQWAQRPRSRHRLHGQLAEGLSHLDMGDAADLVRTVLERQKPGYHCYLPAQMMHIVGVSVPDLIREHYSELELRAPLESITSLIDISALERDLAWRPKTEPIRFELED